MKKNLLFLIPFSLTFSLFLFPYSLYSQDTIRYMSYNLLNYGLPYNLCNESQNNISLKDQYIRTIFSYAQPDLFAVVEMIEGNDNVQRLLDSAINAAGPRTFVKTTATDFSNSNIINMLYYDPIKFHLQSQDAIITSLRDIDIYNFFLNTSDLAVIHDTIFLSVIIAHLKAGSGQSNENERAAMTLSLMNYLQAKNKQGNLILSGDFNFYTSGEQGYQNLLNFSSSAYNFFDPINRPGSWNSNASFADIHTQSTHSSSNGCAASGGLDDRFDFILTSHPLMLGTEGMQTMPDTYRALGQDGQHYNLSVNAQPDNTSVPPDVLNALYSNSDHLPVIMDIKTAKALAVNDILNNPFEIYVVNPAQNSIDIRIGRLTTTFTIDCINLMNELVYQKEVTKEEGSTIKIPTDSFKPGIYLLRFTTGSGYSFKRKVILL